MISKVNIDEFLKLIPNAPLFDVRSPSEFNHAHIPGALSLPLFTDAERAMIGTAYKQESREKAIKIGLESYGRNMVRMVEDVEKIVASKKNGSREVCLHCWRGGMRSAAVAWLLDLYGFKVYLLSGGYKMYRKWVREQLTKPYPLLILGGYTGSSKTLILHQLKKEGHKIIDLEQLALHKGSAFGNLEMIEQPGQEHFENLLARELDHLNTNNKNETIWVEGESQRLGNINIPQEFFVTMRQSPLLFLDIPFEKRLDQIVIDYGKYDKDKIIGAIVRIKKKLGGLETKTAINCLLEDDVKGCFAFLLKYYDKLYLKSTMNPGGKERAITYVTSADTDVESNLKKLIQYGNR